MGKPYEYMKDEKIIGCIERQGSEYQKSAVTLGRLPESVGGELITYIKGAGGIYLEETRNTITDDVVIARNPEPLGTKDGEPIYNEWLVPKETWEKNYGRLPEGTEPEPMKKSATLKAIPVSAQMLKMMGSEDGKTATIAVDWAEDGMKVELGGYLTDQGYSIGREEMAQTYEQVSKDKDSAKDRTNDAPSLG